MVGNFLHFVPHNQPLFHNELGKHTVDYYNKNRYPDTHKSNLKLLKLLAVVYDAFSRIEKEKFRRLFLHKRKASQHAFRYV